MNTIFNSLMTLCENNEISRKVYRQALALAEQDFIRALDEMGYHPEPTTCVDTLPLNTNTQMQHVMNEKKLFQSDCRVGISAFVRYVAKVIDDFLDEVYLGTCVSCAGNSAGQFTIEISCLLHDDSESADSDYQAKFPTQLATLNELGMTVKQKRNGWYYMIGEKSIAIVDTILRNRGAYDVHIDIAANYTIRKITFQVCAEDVHRFAVSEYAKTKTAKPAQNTDELTETDLCNLRTKLMECKTALDYCRCGETPETNGAVAERRLADMCCMCNFHGDIAKRVAQHCSRQKYTNQEIRNIYEQIGASFPADKYKQTFAGLKENIQYFVAHNLHAKVSGFGMNARGQLQLELRWIDNDEELNDSLDFELEEGDIPLAIEDYINIMSLHKTAQDKYWLLDTEQNRMLVKKFIETVPGMNLDSIVVCCDGAINHIDKMCVCGTNLTGMIQWYDK